MRESDLYKPVAKFLESHYGCNHKFTWLAGSGTDLSFSAGFGKRKPDVVACKTSPVRQEVHLVEGKLLNIPTHGFEETLNQLDSFRPFVDYLWAVFPSTRWLSAKTNHYRWCSLLRQRGYGLLLVDNGRVGLQFEAFPNYNIDPTSKKMLLDSLLGESDDPMPLRTLASETAETAIRTVARVVDVMTGPVRNIVGKNKKQSTFTELITYTRKPYFVIGAVGSGMAYIQGDPFGAYLNDGRALIWIWREIGRLDRDERKIRLITSREHPADVYFFSDNDSWQWICRPLAELSLESLKASGFLGEFSLGRAIPISDRSMSRIENDIRRLFNWARAVRASR